MSKTTWTTERTDELRTLKSQGQTNWQIAELFGTTADAVRAKWADVLRADDNERLTAALRETEHASKLAKNELRHTLDTIDLLNAKVARLEQELSMATYVIQAYPQQPLWRRIWGAITGKLN